MNRSLTSKASRWNRRERKIVSIVHNCKYSFFFILVSLFLGGIDRESFPFFSLSLSLFFIACCAFSINYPRRQQQQQRNFCFDICINSIIIFLFAYMYSLFCYRDNINELFLFLSSIWNNLFNLCVSFRDFFFFPLLSLSFLLYYTCLVRVGANLTYACRDRYARTHIHTYIHN